ncbi:hypothetical protein MKX03_006254 [Papaver bracteatum]|nr:hypothetical protein MKX03_006254 [Papaver bracteatum]
MLLKRNVSYLVFMLRQTGLEVKLRKYMANLAKVVTGEWIVLGDLNLTLNVHEKRGSTYFNISEADKIKRLIAMADLEDLGFVVYKFTWTNRREDRGLIEARLDRGLASSNFCKHNKNATIKHLLDLGSDHSPIMLNTNSQQITKHKPFKVLGVWLNEQSCLDVISSSWDNQVTGSNAYRIVQKLTYTKHNIRLWNKHTFGDIRVNISTAKINLAKAISNPNISNRSHVIKQYEEVLAHWFKSEEIFLKDKSGDKEVQLGDRNTKYFHTKTQNRWRRNRIEAIKDGQGNWVEGNENVISVITDHFRKVATTSNPSLCSEYLNMVHQVSTCTFCGNAMIAGDGTAVFTAGCSHSFHFNCFNTSVKYGNRSCPTCGAKWKDIPTIHPAPAPSTPPPPPFCFHPSPAPLLTHFRPIDVDYGHPLFFNDDDPLNLRSNSSSDNTSVIRSIDIKTYTEYPSVPRSISQENFHILVNLKSNVTGTDQVNNDTCRTPIDLVTVLDISGSMQGEKIQLLKGAMRFVIQNLGPSDRLSVISFSSDASRLSPLFLMTDSGKQRALQAVNYLFASGATNIVEGLKIGTKVIEDRRHKNPVCSIMLLSDRQDTCTYAETINVKEISKLQIPVHTFGFGADHDSTMLHSIAESSRRTFSFIENEGVIQDAFAQRIGGLLSVAVQDLKVHIKSLDPHLSISQLKAGSYSTSLTGKNQLGSVDIGDLYADEERDFLVLMNIPVVTDEDSNDQMKLLSVWCDYKNPFTKESVTTEAIEVKLQRPGMVNEEDMVVSIEVDRQKNRLQDAEAMSNSRAAAERGDLTGAQSILDDCRMQMADTVSALACDELSADLDLDLQEARSRVANKKVYASKGRGFFLSEMSSHSRQMASATRFSAMPMVQNFAMAAASGLRPQSAYQTDAMCKMVRKSRASAANFPPATENTQQKNA